MPEDPEIPENTTVPQPVSVHDSEHKGHGALPLITAMLGVFLVLETIGVSYMATHFVNRRAVQDRLDARRAEAAAELEAKKAELKAKQVPYVYLSGNNDVIVVDRQTGEEKTVYGKKDADGALPNLLVVPQVGYDGRIFVGQVCDGCDLPSWTGFKEIDVNNDNAVQEAAFSDALGYRASDFVSPDQTHIAVLGYKDMSNPATGEVDVIDVLTGESTMLAQVGTGEYVSEFFGDNTFAGASGYHVWWKDRNCFAVNIYTNGGSDPTNNQKTYLEQRTYCVEE